MTYSIINQRAYFLACLRTKHPRIAKHIENMWEGPNVEDYMVALLIDADRGTRAGFDPDTYKTILKLYTIYSFEHDHIEKWSRVFVDNPATIANL